MASMEEYLKKQETAYLEFILAEYCAGREHLPADAVLMICEILARRDPRKPLVDEFLRDACRVYLPK